MKVMKLKIKIKIRTFAKKIVKHNLFYESSRQLCDF